MTSKGQITEQRPLLQRWADTPGCNVAAYTKLEIAAEKLRCILQRRQCRDFLDLELLLGGQDLLSIADLFRRKATHRGLDPATFAEKFEKRVHDHEDHWDAELSQYLGQVPHFDEVERNVRRAFRKAGLIWRVSTRPLTPFEHAHGHMGGVRPVESQDVVAELAGALAGLMCPSVRSHGRSLWKILSGMPAPRWMP